MEKLASKKGKIEKINSTERDSQSPQQKELNSELHPLLR
jgi:hypothetical protein